jgi:hypothetical protein
MTAPPVRSTRAHGQPGAGPNAGQAGTPARRGALTDARTGPAGGSGRYGEEALQAFARDLAPATAAAAIAAIAALLGDLAGGLDDDTAILALGVPAASR